MLKTRSAFAATLILVCLCAAIAPPARAQQTTQTTAAAGGTTQTTANIHALANYSEDKVGSFTLPDPLKLNDGTPVDSVRIWQRKRRLEILKMFQDEEYGRGPGSVPADLKFKVISVKKDALGGKATRRIVHIYLANHPAWGGMDLMIYVPNSAKKPVPAFLGLNFRGNHAVSTEKDVPASPRWYPFGKKDSPDPETQRGKESVQWPIEAIIAHGYAVATVWYGEIEPDRPGAWKEGVRGALAQDSRDKTWDPERDWSAIGAWAWGLSRALDYLQGDPGVSAKRVAVIGHSRLGKTAVWAGASDERFAMVISNDSGEGGVALARRNFGETIATMSKVFPHWFCAKHWSYVGHVNDMPIDQHMLVALVAPRPIYIASGVEDIWSDPNGEFLGGKNAEPVYALFGKAGLGVDQQPPLDHPVGDFIRYHVRTGGHDMKPYDWEQYMAFADQHLK